MSIDPASSVNLGRPIVLASASPRRRELLGQLVEEFEVVVAPVDEDALTVPDPWETAERLALAKARAVAALRPEALVIGGDTVVAIEGKSSPPASTPGTRDSRDGVPIQLAKPVDEEDARRMLRALSGRSHVVITGVALVSADGERCFAETTMVTFRDLSDAEISAYVATGEPKDKAGAYAIQGGAAGFVVAVEGSRDNVIGLPTERLRSELRAQRQ